MNEIIRNSLKGWQVIVTDSSGNIIDENSRRRSRRGGSERIFLQRISDGVSFTRGDSILVNDKTTKTYSIYCINEIRLNTLNNPVELIGFTYLRWFEVAPLNYYKELSPSIYDNASKSMDYYKDKFLKEVNKNEIFLTAELSEISIKDFINVANVVIPEKWNNESMKLDQDFILKYICEPDSSNFTEVNFESMKKTLVEYDPKSSENYLKRLSTRAKNRLNTITKPKTVCKVEVKVEPPSLNFEGESKLSSKPQPNAVIKATSVKATSLTTPSETNTKSSKISSSASTLANENTSLSLQPYTNDKLQTNVTDINQIPPVHDASKESFAQNSISKTPNQNNNTIKKKLKPEYTKSESNVVSVTETGIDTNLSSNTSQSSIGDSSLSNFTKTSISNSTKSNRDELNSNSDEPAIPLNGNNNINDIQSNVMKNKALMEGKVVKIKSRTMVEQIKGMQHKYRKYINVLRTLETTSDEVVKDTKKNSVEVENYPANNSFDDLYLKPLVGFCEKVCNDNKKDIIKKSEYSRIFCTIVSFLNTESSGYILVKGILSTGKTFTIQKILQGLLDYSHSKSILQIANISLSDSIEDEDQFYSDLWNQLTDETLNKHQSKDALNSYFLHVSKRKKRHTLIIMDNFNPDKVVQTSFLKSVINWSASQESKLIVVSISRDFNISTLGLSSDIFNNLNLTNVLFEKMSKAELFTLVQMNLQALSERLYHKNGKQLSINNHASTHGGLVQIMLPEKEELNHMCSVIANISTGVNDALDICINLVKDAIQYSLMNQSRNNFHSRIKLLISFSTLKSVMAKRESSNILKSIMELPFLLQLALVSVYKVSIGALTNNGEDNFKIISRELLKFLHDKKYKNVAETFNNCILCSLGDITDKQMFSVEEAVTFISWGNIFMNLKRLNMVKLGVCPRNVSLAIDGKYVEEFLENWLT
ncbi:hypothetical protein TPHA_0B01710 [Tetrapisispora phaffii CBS 4417]|uniref:BAH domain-containing protein n=1 Tax=Tetrapisispora phaffii (strain ATCC 24235 / CBS 4417 / NBRC 1672 / NRRL Y-8282 / UCD 70-5) TaxID=1071381 RepID=G8BPB3_TETPH|nr:hypothetical protein TPHA_0B01710 [Tetrapisispora phaffii CBS 4417]CCE61844.1 hypothetical protein TPHA_0B01710 [Tetrapisispora phaffii CBS 4417]